MKLLDQVVPPAGGQWSLHAQARMSNVCINSDHHFLTSLRPSLPLDCSSTWFILMLVFKKNPSHFYMNGPSCFQTPVFI